MSYLTADRMTQKELEGEIATIMQKAREGTVTARDASRLLELKQALARIKKVLNPWHDYLNSVAPDPEPRKVEGVP